MALLCKDLCQKHKARFEHSKGMYLNGYRFCRVCQVWFNTDSLYCICCGGRLGARPRSKKSKLLLSKMVVLVKQ
ncbi:MAG: hypothetical protein DA330_02500 [Nitrososphaera sp.]|nr:hypothetical protein [Nitrososphaera sp.]